TTDLLPRRLTEEMGKSGRKVHSKVLSCGWVLPAKRIQNSLQVAEGEKVLQMIRLRHIDDEPVFYSESHFSQRVGLDVTDDFSGSLFTLLRDKCGIRVIEADMIIDAVPAGSAEAVHLEVVKGVPLLRTTRVAFGADGKPVEYLTQLARPDRYRHQVRLKPE
ncbi:MAG TPA: UTRA domain-containing protein, partial [Firmicutes bacterium]|nr:UTRA domain-containing protein [Bacillota bacterium]